MANSKRKCTGCKSYYPVEKMTQLPIGWFCGITCASEYAFRRTKKSQQRRAKQIQDKNNSFLRQRKKALKTKSQWMQEAQGAVNKFVRTRDSGNGCITCGARPEEKSGGTVDAGHYLSRGARPHLRFNTFNIHSQCVKCNRYLSGMAAEYRINLIDKIGLARVERLEQDHTSRTFTIEYLERVKKIFNKRARLYQKLRGL